MAKSHPRAGIRSPTLKPKRRTSIQNKTQSQKTTVCSIFLHTSHTFLEAQRLSRDFRAKSKRSSSAASKAALCSPILDEDALLIEWKAVFENKVTPSTNQVKQKRYDFMAETSVDLENKTPNFYKCWAAIGEVDQIACHSRWVAKHGKPERTTQSQLSKRKSNPAKEKKKAEEAARKEKHDAMIREMDERMDAHILDIEAQNAAGLGEYAQAHGLEPWYKRLSHKLFG